MIATGLLFKLAVACLLTATTLGFQHYFRWDRVFGHDLRVPWNYAIGVGTLGLYYTAWLWAADRALSAREVALGFWAIVAAGGVTIIGCYLLDWHLANRAVQAGRESLGGKGGQGREAGHDRPH